MTTVDEHLQVLAREVSGMFRNTHDIVAETRPFSPLGHEELWVMLAFRHDLHVDASVGGVWNDDFRHDFVGRGIAYNLSHVSHSYHVQNASIDRVVFWIGMFVVVMCMYDEHSLSTLWDFQIRGFMVMRTFFRVVVLGSSRMVQGASQLLATLSTTLSNHNLSHRQSIAIF